MERGEVPENDLPGEPAGSGDTARLAMQMPWAIGYEVRRWAAYPYIRLMFALHGIHWGNRWRIWGMPILQRYAGSQITIAAGLKLRSWRSTNPLTPNHPVVLATRSADAQIWIGEDVGMTGAILVAASRIEMGDRVLVGANPVIVDTDFHPLDPVERRIHVNAGDSPADDHRQPAPLELPFGGVRPPRGYRCAPSGHCTKRPFV